MQQTVRWQNILQTLSNPECYYNCESCGLWGYWVLLVEWLLENPNKQSPFCQQAQEPRVKPTSSHPLVFSVTLAPGNVCRRDSWKTNCSALALCLVLLVQVSMTRARGCRASFLHQAPFLPNLTPISSLFKKLQFKHLHSVLEEFKDWLSLIFPCLLFTLLGLYSRVEKSILWFALWYFRGP